MIKIARETNPNPRIKYIPIPAQSYITDKEYDIIISSSALSMIRNISDMFKAIDNCIIMLRKGGYFLFIDPLHKINLLARAKISTDEIITYMRKKGLELVERDGMLFWPIRVLISADTSLTEHQTRVLFRAGEKMQAVLGKNIWSDYKILLLRK
jgi:hypothetical protein